MRYCQYWVKDEEGSTTIESLFWIPFFIFLMAITVDISMIFNAHARILGIIQDVDRSYSVGRIADDQSAEDTVRNMLSQYGDSLSVTTSVNNGVIGTTVKVPMSKLVATGFLGNFLSAELTVQDFRFKEM
ncbi:TadE/TadG family type IV pilus assembly protein [Thioclava atlantica]|uniref:TadE-like protein n=1 Tax=Thioclava atlantica TaxID=1317124 RepID=A0A085TXH0_9RHOB|nr:hypothetical protein [Thioclava atlantica]KFE35417.1 hypothetical protein DW2_08307 [Thioclava atlantica]